MRQLLVHVCVCVCRCCIVPPHRPPHSHTTKTKRAGALLPSELFAHNTHAQRDKWNNAGQAVGRAGGRAHIANKKAKPARVYSAVYGMELQRVVIAAIHLPWVIWPESVYWSRSQSVSQSERRPLLIKRSRYMSLFQTLTVPLCTSKICIYLFQNAPLIPLSTKGLAYGLAFCATLVVAHFICISYVPWWIASDWLANLRRAMYICNGVGTPDVRVLLPVQPGYCSFRCTWLQILLKPSLCWQFWRMAFAWLIVLWPNLLDGKIMRFFGAMLKIEQFHVAFQFLLQSLLPLGLTVNTAIYRGSQSYKIWMTAGGGGYCCWRDSLHRILSNFIAHNGVRFALQSLLFSRAGSCPY